MATAKEMRAQTSTRAQLYAPVIKLYASSGGELRRKSRRVRGMLWVHRAKVVQAMDRQGSRQ